MRIVRYVDASALDGQDSLFLPLGIYVFEPDVLGFISTDSYMDIKEQLIPALIDEKQKVQACLVSEDVNKLGNVRDYFDAHEAIFKSERSCAPTSRASFASSGSRSTSPEPSSSAWRGNTSAGSPTARPGPTSNRPVR